MPLIWYMMSTTLENYTYAYFILKMLWNPCLTFRSTGFSTADQSAVRNFQSVSVSGLFRTFLIVYSFILVCLFLFCMYNFFILYESAILEVAKPGVSLSTYLIYTYRYLMDNGSTTIIILKTEHYSPS